MTAQQTIIEELGMLEKARLLLSFKSKAYMCEAPEMAATLADAAQSIATELPSLHALLAKSLAEVEFPHSSKLMPMVSSPEPQSLIPVLAQLSQCQLPAHDIGLKDLQQELTLLIHAIEIFRHSPQKCLQPLLEDQQQILSWMIDRAWGSQ